MVSARLIRTLALLGLGCGLCVVHTQPGGLTVQKIADDLHVIAGSGGNVAVLITGDGVILVDDKFERNVVEIQSIVKTLTDKPIRYVINTHQHGDHTGGNQKLMESAVEILIHRNARANMAQLSQPGAPRITFADQAELFLGGKQVVARHLGRGHTNGDAVILFPAHRFVHMGDMFVSGAPFIDAKNGGSGVAWTATLDQVLKLDFEGVIPGHGPIGKKQDLASWKKNFEDVRSSLQRLKQSGKTLEQAGAELDLTAAGWDKNSFAQRSLPALFGEL